ncbi:amidase signature enzyme [Vararia minispora EC-137]|uniref:Amidase signature enzyme n=1 Tax=Vararia minispora EC-137 TaxID=1314806 RepID=A0ACB8QZR0_9AGAM|nr:amidase signature enzyme [Vararia minispora EC-137]
MFLLSEYWAHRRTCKLKQQEREQRIQSLPQEYHDPISEPDADILAKPVSEIVALVNAGKLAPRDILLAYGKKALVAHRQTNCLTEIMIPSAEDWAKHCDTAGPLAGMPISLKDTVCVAGYDSTAGYSAQAFKPATHNAALTQLLLDAGAIPFVKTNIPITLLAFESASDLWGTAVNAHVPGYSPGGSTGGEGSLLAFGGSRLGIGTDVAGSVRMPAHFSGVYTVKATVGRFMKAGNFTPMVGQEGIPPVYSPMARTLEDLEMFWKAVTSMKPWEYDPYCVPLPWREIKLPSRLRIGVLRDDGVVVPSPACKRALDEVVSALQEAGHEVFPIEPPAPAEALRVGSQLMANGVITATSHIRAGEACDPGAAQALRALQLPNFLRRLWAWYIRYLRRDPLYADLIAAFRPQSGQEFYARIGDREAYKMRWHAFWDKNKMDFVLTVPNALPATRFGESRTQWKSCLPTFLFNVQLDYSAGVLPITRVDSALDDIAPGTFRPRNAIEAGAYKGYDAKSMHGLPVGVQLVARRYEEEKVIEGMKLVEGLLKARGKAYQLLL